MSRMFVPSNPSHFDFRDAEAEYGPVVLLFPHDEPVSPLDPMVVARRAYEKLRRYAFDPTQDYIALTGDSRIVPVVVAVATAIAHKHYPGEPLDMLVYDAKTGSYLERQLSIEEVCECTPT